MQKQGCCQSTRVLKHIVLFKFQPTATPEQIKSVVDGFCALPTKIQGVKCFEWGTDVSPEKKSQGFTHAFVLTFASEADRDAYLPAPAHQEFVAMIKPYVQEALVVDYWQAPGSSKCCASCKCASCSCASGHCCASCCGQCPMMKGQAGCPTKDKASCPMKDNACPVKDKDQVCPKKAPAQGCPASSGSCPLKK
ncbi:MAG: Dabb family protein [Phycisphaerae bacterium]|nr:Dabb family protein [Phycisphaerae bacterium]